MKKSPTCFDATEKKTAVLSKQVGDFLQILWPSHNVLTLTTNDIQAFFGLLALYFVAALTLQIN